MALRRVLMIGASAFALAASALAVQIGGGVQAAHGFDPTKLTEVQDRLLSGFASFELTSAAGAEHSSKPPNYFTKGKADCALKYADNVKVNQNCLNLADPDLQGRSQAQNETAIALDPNNPDHLVASYNDYRRGDGNCGISYSSDRGKTWNDSTVPTSFTRGGTFGGKAREYWQAAGDTSVAFDTKGNAYLSCQVFNRGAGASANPDFSSAFYLYRSTGNSGASWNFPGRPISELPDTNGDGDALLDKQYMTVDNRVGSPFQDRIYVTWTRFGDDGTGYIFEAYSNDYGEHFSTPRVVSTNNSALCTNTYGLPTPQGRCNENQDSQPFVGPDGTLYVAFNNYNNTPTGNDNRNQVLLSRSTDGGNTFSAPVKVGDFYDLPDCATYQNGADPGRGCVPEKANTAHSIFRANNYPSGGTNPTNRNQVVVTFGSYINSHSNESSRCVPAGVNPDTGINLYSGVKTPGACNNDILVSVSNDGGRTFTGTTTDPRRLTSVTQDPAQATTDQFWQWASFTKDGTLAVDYYDRQFGNDETTGASDFTLSASKGLTSWGSTRVTSSSMPPPTQFDGVFYGDYIGLAAWDQAYPVWSDTRPPDLFVCPGTATTSTPPGVCFGTEGGSANPQAGLQANDQDIFAASSPVPNKGK